MVETSENWELTARHFGAQVKGRTAKPQNGYLKVKIETKHLKYYTECRDPVFLFRIDPDTETGNWVFIQRYLKQKGMAEKPKKQGSLTIDFDPNRNLGDQELFKKDVKEALAFMADEFPGSPRAALAKRKEFLESLDPNVVIEQTATDKGVTTIVNAKPGAPIVGSNIAGPFSAEQLEALSFGEKVTIQASKLQADSPVAQHLLCEAGDNEIIIQSGIDVPKISGSVQIRLEGGSDFILQLNGEWTRTPTQFYFEATLPEAPLHLKCVWAGATPADFGSPDMTFGFKYSNWAGQPLSHLAHIDDLKRLLEGHPMRIRFLIRGQQFQAGKIESSDLAPGEDIGEAIDWIGKLKQTAEFLWGESTISSGRQPRFPVEL